MLAHDARTSPSESLRSSRWTLGLFGLTLAVLLGIQGSAATAARPEAVASAIIIALAALCPWRLPIVGRIDLVIAVPIVLARLELASAAVPIAAAVWAGRALARKRASGRPAIWNVIAGSSACAVAAGCAVGVHRAIDSVTRGTDRTLVASLVSAGVEACAFAAFLAAVRWWSGQRTRFEVHRAPAIASEIVRAVLTGGFGAAATWLVAYGQGPLVVAGLATTAYAAQWYQRETARSRAGRRILSAESRTHAWESLLVQSLNGGDPTREEMRARIEHGCLLLGTRLGLSPCELRDLATAARLHDLADRGTASPANSRPIRSRPPGHGVAGRGPDDRVAAVPDEGVREILLHRDERWDGTGSPNRLAGAAIPSGSCVLALIRTYVHHTPDGSSSQTHVEVLAQLSLEAGRAFAPRHVEELTFLFAEPEGRLIRASSAPDSSEIVPDRDSGRLFRAREWLRTLDSIEQARQTSSSRDDFLILLAARLREVLTHRSLVVYQLEGRDILVARFAWGEAASRLRLVQLPLGERVSGRALLEQRCVIGSRSGPRIAGDLEAWGEGELDTRLDAALAAPILSDAAGLGVLTVYDGPHREWSPEEREGLLAVASRIAPMLNRREDSEGSELTDRLTGLPAAPFLRHAAARRMLDASADVTPFGLLAFQVHGMEAALSTAGEEGERRVLVDLSRRLATSCFADETLVRYGRDVFVVLTGRATEEALIARWSALQARAAMPFDLPGGNQARIRLTAAHAICPDDADGVTGLLRVLDDRLSQAALHRRVVVPFRKGSDRLAAS